ncbi:hypothetical protein [Pseudanabaena sp. PCC 6802]|uniref:hypothetical protein n=1 Tax=Pseudanabaena sp. PCC 6802 TaxID=118173 RepID=UPI000345DA1F|nr:hypothetical protein [Pseudanabaena sp. PCC 6802]
MLKVAVQKLVDRGKHKEAMENVLESGKLHEFFLVLVYVMLGLAVLVCEVNVKPGRNYPGR